MGRKTYSAEKIAQTKVALIGLRGSVKKTAQHEDVARSTVRRWAAGDYPEHVDPAKVEATAESIALELAEKWERVAGMAAEKVADLIPHETRAKDAAIVAGIATEKSQLLRGKPTERTEVVDFVSWLRQPPAERTKTGTNVVPEPGASVLPVKKQN